MTRMLTHAASLLPGILALTTALLVAALIAWALSAVLRRSLISIEFDRRVAQWGWPALSEWSPSSSPTLLVTRTLACIVILIGFLIGITAFDGTLPSQFVMRLFAYLKDVIAAVVVLIAGSIAARFLARSALIGAVNMNLQYRPAAKRRCEMAGDCARGDDRNRAAGHRRRHYSFGVWYFVWRNRAGAGSGSRAGVQGAREPIS